jgi:hypothetical protein
MKQIPQLLRLLPFLALAASLQITLGYYDPAAQRWINRDPADESGFRYLRPNQGPPESAGDSTYYTYVANAAPTSVDAYGLVAFSKGCKQADIATMKAELKDRCKRAKEKNCFRCLTGLDKKAMETMCSTVDDSKAQPYVICEYSPPAGKCGKSPDGKKTQGGWTDGLGRVHLCMNNLGLGQFGCVLIHEAAHSQGGVGGDAPDEPKPDNDAYAIEKCVGCYVDPGLPLPPGY